LGSIYSEAQAEMVSVKPELDIRKYFEFKLMMGFDERYAIAKPLGDYAGLLRQLENKVVDIEEELVVQQPVV
jgi:hypothetical protein